jgi:predicted Zn-dependent protease
LKRLGFILALCASATGLRAHPEIEEALARLNPLIAASPDNAALYLERGALYARHQDWITAEANYLRAAELAPKLVGLERARGALALASGQPAEARQHLDAALATDATDAEALILRGRAYAAVKARASALADYNAALRHLSSPTPEFFLERAALYPSPGEAIRSLDEAIARLGSVVTLELRALALEESAGRIDAALARIDRLATQSERQETWLKRRGDLLVRAGRRVEARAAYAAAVAAISTLPEWLQQSPDTARLLGELRQLTASTS